jgi:hypothetical protein
MAGPSGARGDRRLEFMKQCAEDIVGASLAEGEHFRLAPRFGSTSGRSHTSMVSKKLT